MNASLFHPSAFRTLTAALLILAVGGGAWAEDSTPGASAGKPAFRTEKVVRDELFATVTATGTVEPAEVIDVGAQVSGLIQKLGPADPTKPDGPVVDYGAAVKKDQVLAVIDSAPYKTRVDQAVAAVKTAQAALKIAKASLAKAKVNRDAQQDAYDRDASSAGAVSKQQIIADKQAVDIAAADCTIQEATIEQAEAGVLLAEANLKEAQANLEYCTVKSPVDGVVIERRVDVGQTVVASLSAPSLFLIAKDLSKMQIWMSVNEADIGAIHVGQDAAFTVDARPGKLYKANVVQIRLNANRDQKAVTYTVVAAVANPPLAGNDKPKNPTGETAAADRELLPYLTAHVTVIVAEPDNVLLVPSAALRWKPQLNQVAPDYRDEYERSLRQQATKKSETGAQVAANGVVWVEDKGFVRPIKVVTGLSDESRTEVLRVLADAKLDEGAAVVVGDSHAGDDLKSPPPFIPKKIKDDK